MIVGAPWPIEGSWEDRAAVESAARDGIRSRLAHATGGASRPAIFLFFRTPIGWFAGSRPQGMAGSGVGPQRRRFTALPQNGGDRAQVAADEYQGLRLGSSPRTLPRR